MDFNFTDEQQQFRDALRRYLDNEYTFDARQKIVVSKEGVDAEHWTAFTELGLTALPAPEAQGGFDGGPADMLVVMQELGRALVVEPYWATAVGIEALRLVGDDHANALLERAAGGEIKLAVAFHEPHARYDLFSIDTTAKENGDGFALSGRKSLVLHGAQADYWIVPARLNGEVGLFAVARRDHGVSDDRWPARRDAHVHRYARHSSRRRQDRRSHARAHCRLRYVLAVRRSRRCTRRAESRDGRIHEGAQAVRHAHRAFPGVAASHGRDADSCRAGALDHVSGSRAIHERGRR